MVHFQYEVCLRVHQSHRKAGGSDPPSPDWWLALACLRTQSWKATGTHSAVRPSPWSEKGTASSPKYSLDKGMRSKPMRWGIGEGTSSRLWEKTEISPNLGLQKPVPYQTSTPVISALSLWWHPILQNCILKTLFPLASWVYNYFIYICEQKSLIWIQHFQ